MTVSAEDIMQLSHRLQQDLRAANAKLVELRAMLAQLPIPKRNEITCPRCTIEVPGPRALTAHLENVHGEYQAST